MTENLPSDVSDPNISILFKKRDRSQCGNYRGISLLSVVGKVFADILSQRLKHIAEKSIHSHNLAIVRLEVQSTASLRSDSLWRKLESSAETCTLLSLISPKPSTR